MFEYFPEQLSLSAYLLVQPRNPILRMLSPVKVRSKVKKATHEQGRFKTFVKRWKIRKIGTIPVRG